MEEIVERSKTQDWWSYETEDRDRILVAQARGLLRDREWDEAIRTVEKMQNDHARVVALAPVFRLARDLGEEERIVRTVVPKLESLLPSPELVTLIGGALSERPDLLLRHFAYSTSSIAGCWTWLTMLRLSKTADVH